MIAAFFCIKYGFNKMVAMKYLFRKYLALMMIIIDKNTMTILGEEYVYITIGRITMKLALDIVSQSFMAVAQG